MRSLAPKTRLGKIVGKTEAPSSPVAVFFSADRLVIPLVMASIAPLSHSEIWCRIIVQQWQLGPGQTLQQGIKLLLHSIQTRFHQ